MAKKSAQKSAVASPAAAGVLQTNPQYAQQGYPQQQTGYPQQQSGYPQQYPQQGAPIYAQPGVEMHEKV